MPQVTYIHTYAHTYTNATGATQEILQQRAESDSRIHTYIHIHTHTHRPMPQVTYIHTYAHTYTNGHRCSLIPTYTYTHTHRPMPQVTYIHTYATHTPMPQVLLKKSYNNERRVTVGLLCGNEWYTQQAFRALNQVNNSMNIFFICPYESLYIYIYTCIVCVCIYIDTYIRCRLLCGNTWYTQQAYRALNQVNTVNTLLNRCCVSLPE